MSRRIAASRALSLAAALLAALGASQAQAATASQRAERAADARFDRLQVLAERNHALELAQRHLGNELDWTVEHAGNGARAVAEADRLQALSKADGALLTRERALIDGVATMGLPTRLATQVDTLKAEIARNHAIDRREQELVNVADWRLAHDRPTGTTEALADGLQRLSAKANSFGRYEERMINRVDARLDQ